MPNSRLTPPDVSTVIYVQLNNVTVMIDLKCLRMFIVQSSASCWLRILAATAASLLGLNSVASTFNSTVFWLACLSQLSSMGTNVVLVVPRSFSQLVILLLLQLHLFLRTATLQYPEATPLYFFRRI